MLDIGGELNLVTAAQDGEIQVFNPSKNEVTDRFSPDGQPTCLRVFDQYPGILFMSYTKKAPGGSLVGTLFLLSNGEKQEIEAHENHIMDIECMSVNTENFKGEVFFTCSMDCKYYFY